MSDTAVATISTGEHLTQDARQALEADLAGQLKVQRLRATEAAIRLEEFSSADSPADREAARENLLGLLDGVHQLEEALQRLDVGTYGICDTCLEPIPLPRLEAIPEVTHCIGCAPIG